MSSNLTGHKPTTTKLKITPRFHLLGQITNKLSVNSLMPTSWGWLHQYLPRPFSHRSKWSRSNLQIYGWQIALGRKTPVTFWHRVLNETKYFRVFNKRVGYRCCFCLTLQPPQKINKLAIQLPLLFSIKKAVTMGVFNTIWWNKNKLGQLWPVIYIAVTKDVFYRI